MKTSISPETKNHFHKSTAGCTMNPNFDEFYTGGKQLNPPPTQTCLRRARTYTMKTLCTGLLRNMFKVFKKKTSNTTKNSFVRLYVNNAQNKTENNKHSQQNTDRVFRVFFFECLCMQNTKDGDTTPKALHVERNRVVEKKRAIVRTQPDNFFCNPLYFR